VLRANAAAVKLLGPALDGSEELAGALGQAATGAQDRPVEPVVVESVNVERSQA